MVVGIGAIVVTDDMVDRAVNARIALYREQTYCKSIHDLGGALLAVHRREARAMLEAALGEVVT